MPILPSKDSRCTVYEVIMFKIHLNLQAVMLTTYLITHKNVILLKKTLWSLALIELLK